MKRCPYCAEEIQEAAVLCRFCSRAQKSRHEDRDPWVRAAAALVVFGVALGGVAVASRAGATERLRAAVHQLTLPRGDTLPSLAPVRVTYTPPPPPPPPPAVFDVVDMAEPRRLEAGEYLWYRVRLDDPRPCRLDGRVAVLAGGSHDADVFVLDEDGFSNFQYGHEIDPVFAEQRTSAVSLNLELESERTYYVVVSNRFSAFTSKLVQLSDVRATCDGGGRRTALRME